MRVERSIEAPNAVLIFSSGGEPYVPAPELDVSIVASTSQSVLVVVQHEIDGPVRVVVTDEPLDKDSLEGSQPVFEGKLHLPGMQWVCENVRDPEVKFADLPQPDVLCRILVDEPSNVEFMVIELLSC